MPRFLAGTSIAGDGIRERLQAATFAMFGAVTAIGLVLVGIAYNQTWPDFADSPIPGIPTERVDRATVAAGAVHGQAHSGNGPASLGSSQAGRTDFAPGGSPGHHSSSHQQLPVTTPDGQVPGPASSGPGGAAAPGSPAPAPAPQAAAPPAPVAAQPAPAPAPVAAAPPAAEPAETPSVPGNGKAKGHEKAEKPAKPEKPRGKPAPVTPAPPPSVPAPTPETSVPAGPGNGSGKGNAKGHEK